MAYLISHMAIFLAFAMLLGLLLGWFLWGYVARQRELEVFGLRERIAEMHMESTRLAVAVEQQVPLPEPENVLIEGDLPEPEMVHTSFFQEEPLPAPSLAARLAPVAPDLEAEVREAKVQHLEEQVRELESVRDRIPLLQADLSNAIAGRRSAEAKYQEAKNDFEVKSSQLQSQIRDLESSRQEWEARREELEHQQALREKELSTARAHLRDLQNNQRPQTAEPVVESAAAVAIELADLRDRHQRAVKERDSLAEEVVFWKQNDGTRSEDSTGLVQRIGELEETVRGKEAELQEQVARVETLLWRVAELEPFAEAAPRVEENLRRQESEIAGHMAMHAETADQVRALEERLTQLHAEAHEMRTQRDEHLAELRRTADEHQRSVAEWQQALNRKQAEVEEQAATLQARLGELETARQKAQDLEQELHELEEQSEGKKAAFEKRIAELETEKAQAAVLQNEAAEEFKRQTEEHVRSVAAMQDSLTQKRQEIEQQAAAREVQAKKAEVLEAQIIELEKMLRDEAAKNQDLVTAHSDMQREMQGWKDYSAKLQPIAGKVPGLEKMVSEREAEVSRWQKAHKDKEDALESSQKRLNELQGQLGAHQQRLAEVEPVAARLPEVELTLQEREEAMRQLAERHEADLNRLKVNAAQRLRRLRQGITNIKA